MAIFAFDDDCARVLDELRLERVTIVTLAEFEDQELIAVKPSRTWAEYCWTTTPSTILYCLQALGWDEVTYLDADLFFFSNPEVLFAEMGSASILLTAHNYTPAYDQSKLSGTFCVQFMRFVANDRGLEAAHWWRSKCLEWCYDRRENGKFGDQAYLEDWTTRFKGVHVLENQGGGLAPWNISKYQIRISDEKWWVEWGLRQWDPVFFHFHGVRFFEGKVLGLDNYRLGPVVLEKIYRPYLKRLIAITRRLSSEYPSVDWIRARPRQRGLKAVFGQIKNRLLGTWNFISWDRIEQGD